MNHHANHEWHGAMGKDAAGGMGMFFIPIPMAAFGMCVAFMFGATVGMLWGKKHMMMAGGKQRMGWHKGPHHHHGEGTSACWERHTQMQEAPSETAEP